MIKLNKLINKQIKLKATSFFLSWGLVLVVHSAQIDIRYDPVKDPKLQGFVTTLEQEHTFDIIVKNLNQWIKVPVPLHIRFIESLKGPHYVAKDHTIYLSYNLFVTATMLYQKNYPKAPAQEIRDFSMNLNKFILYHEFGHALIDIYKLPVLSDEESAADAVADMLSLEYDEDYDPVLAASDFFDLLEREIDGNSTGGVDETRYWDDHPMNAQRYYQLVCAAYAFFPKDVEKIYQDGNNQEELDYIKNRGAECKRNVKQYLNNWYETLKKAGAIKEQN